MSDRSCIFQFCKDGTHCCPFPNTQLHQGAMFSVVVTSNHSSCEEVLTFHNPGKNGSSPVNFSCIIYNVHSMNCSWQPGPCAPADVQYHLDTWTKMYGRQETEDDLTECPQYLEDKHGVQVGCHFPDLSELKGWQFYFRLNGTSQHTAVPFLDFPKFEGFHLEKYNPPTDISVEYNSSNHLLRWENPQRRLTPDSSHMLEYELNVQKKGRSRDPVIQEGRDTNVYVVPSVDSHGEHSVRIRVRHKYSSLWSEWSRTIAFGLPEEEDNGVTVVVSVVVASVVFTMVMTFLFRRYSVGQKLFPPIPHVKSMFITSAEVSSWVTRSIPWAFRPPELPTE
ncbi:granulocyte-macrophage colony-stimulating factor receptor subunit alpha-like [Rhynchocyon petersi]